MERQTLKRLDAMITRHQLQLAEMRTRREAVPGDLAAEVNRLEKGLYSLREGVHGFMKAKEMGFPLESLDGYIESIEAVADKIEKSLSDVLAKMQESFRLKRPK
jgi:hypothetical protein